ncbi:MAG: hypothetical protein J6W75_02295 [Bacteroidaceae bacterium]|nr:hypothetical protein [Bacteroidaceae bacterium]
MRKFSILFLFCLFSLPSAWGQTPYTYRYWFDGDTANIQEDVLPADRMVNLPVDKLRGWYHLLRFQVREQGGLWSSVCTQAFVLVPEGNRYEGGQYRYWFDENADTVVTGTMTSEVLPIDIPVSQLTGWLHLLHFQVRDNEGLWSSVGTRSFAMVPEADRYASGQYRYWFDENKEDAVTGSMTSKVLPLDIPVNQLTGWFHLLNFQVADSRGVWISINTRSFALIPDADRRYTDGGRYSYWFDDNMTDAVNGTLTAKAFELEFPVDTMTEGDHVLKMRVWDHDEKYSSVAACPFYLSASSLTILSAEGGTVGLHEDVIREDTVDYNFLDGTWQHLTITPDEGYVVDSVVVNGTENVTSQITDGQLTVVIGEVSAVDVTYALADFMKLGDVNNDKRVSAADIALTVDYLIGGTPSPFIRRQADANSDGEINVGDLTRIVDFITGAVPRGIKRIEKREEEKKEIKDRSYNDVLTGCLTGKGMEIALQNEAEYTAFQMALTLHEGVEAEDVRISAVRRHDHVVASGRLADGRLNVVVYSGKNRPLHGNEGPLLEVSFGDGAAEVDNVQVDDIVFVTKAGEVCKFAPLTISGSDGIERLSTDSFREGKGEAGMVYDLGGRRMPDGKVVKNKLPHGVYIVNGKKIIFK